MYSPQDFSIGEQPNTSVKQEQTATLETSSNSNNGGNNIVIVPMEKPQPQQLKPSDESQTLADLDEIHVRAQQLLYAV